MSVNMKEIDFEMERLREKIKRLNDENERLNNVLKEIKSIVDSIPKGGSKEGRSDYVTMISSDKVYRLRQLVSE